MSFIDQLNTETRIRQTLPPGVYGTTTVPGLKIVSYIGSKEDKSGNLRHSFLVAATGPSKEAKAAFKPSSLVDEPDFEGTAFMALTLRDTWLAPATLALAFSPRDKQGVVITDLAATAVAAGELKQAEVDEARQFFTDKAKERLAAANTPEITDDLLLEDFNKQMDNILIKVGTFFRLQDWKGVQRSVTMNPTDLVGTEFSGTVNKGLGNATTEVDQVMSKKKSK